MRTSLTLARAQLLRGWTSLLGIAVLTAFVGGLVLAGAAGAQRSRTAVDRMIGATDAADVLVNPDSGDDSALDFDTVAALPMVAKFSRISGVGTFPPPPYTDLGAMFDVGSALLATDGGAIFQFEKPVLIAGRLPHVDADDEVYLTERYATSAGYRVGDTLSLRLLPFEEIDAAYGLATSGDEPGALAKLNDPSIGRIVGLRIVGIGNSLDAVAIDEGYEPFGGWIGPAVFAALGKPSAGYGGAVVQLTSPDELENFRVAVSALVPDEKIVFQSLSVTREKALRATSPAATALLVFATVTALLGLLLIGQAISRRFQLDARDNETLAALGTTHLERYAAAMWRLLCAAVAGTLGSVAVATFLSIFTPVGPAAIAEPTPGLAFNATILLIGAAVILIVVMALGALPAWRNTGHRRHFEPERGSAIASWLAARGASASMTTGVRFGLEPGRGRTAVPTRATIVGAMTAVAVAAATVVFAASLDRVVNDGRFYGSNFDVSIQPEDFSEGKTSNDFVIAALDEVARDPSVRAAGQLRIGEIRVNGATVTTLAFSTRADNATAFMPVEPTIGDGRAPATRDEIALGRSTMLDLRVSIGDTVKVTSPPFSGDAHVVGRAVLPGVGLYQGSDRTSIGVGALVTLDMLGTPEQGNKESIVVDLVDGADIAAFESRFSTALSGTATLEFQADGRPSDIRSLARLRSLPVALSIVLVVLVSFTVLHAMVTAVRRRRRDIAVLRALGSTRQELTSVGVWQGVTIGLAALLFGLPLGIVIGRWFWILLATRFGTLAEPVVPLFGVVAVTVGVTLLTAAAGVAPIRRGLRIRPAEVLRSE